MNKGINNPADQKGHLDGKENITLFKHEFLTKYNLDFLKKNKGKSVRLSGYNKCDTTFSKEQHANKKFEDAEVEPNKESTVLEIYLEKQEYLPMGISQTKVFG